MASFDSMAAPPNLRATILWPHFRICEQWCARALVYAGHARFLTPPSRVSEGVSGENGVRKLTDCADRRGIAFESRLAHKSPDFGLTRKSAVSGEIVGEIRKSGFRDLVRNS